MIAIRDLVFHLGATTILEGASFTIQKGERIALIGRNGTGKSTFMKLMNGEFKGQSGQLEYQKGVTLAYLPQDVPTNLEGNVADVILQGLGTQVETLLSYNKQARLVAEDPSEKNLDKLQKFQERLDATSGWQWQSETEKWCSLLELDPYADAQSLSGGLKRRVLLGKALIAKPDVLMLDEPTNHLDIESIQWLESFLLSQKLTLIFVTHDKAFLNKVASAILELDRGKLLRFPSPYSAYLETKEQQLEAEEAERARFNKKLAEEEVWIRKGLQARRTRNMGRVRALETMREELSARKDRAGQLLLNSQSTGKSGAKVFDVKNISYAYDNGISLIKDFTTVISRGEKVGIVGPNGCGKSTFIKLLLGELQVTEGSLEQGTRIELAYFDQLRDQLDETKTPKDVVFDGYEYADISGQRKHVMGYLDQFLFTKDRAVTPINVLSGGEKNRLLLARMLAKPSNVLVLDEPTNDLDMESLELLEDLLVEYAGTVLLVSHDRDFMANVCTQLFVFEGNGFIKEHIGGFENWDQILPAKELNTAQKNAKASPSTAKKSDQPKVNKLSFKEQKELGGLPSKIEKIEEKVTELQALLADSSLYQKADGGKKIKQFNEQVTALQKDIDVAMERWETLLEQQEAAN
jgi:ATP-binding cassette subfamily F protein uup